MRGTLSSPCSTACTRIARYVLARIRVYMTHISGIAGLIGIDLSDSTARILTETTRCLNKDKRARPTPVEKLNVNSFIRESLLTYIKSRNTNWLFISKNKIKALRFNYCVIFFRSYIENYFICHHIKTRHREGLDDSILSFHIKSDFML